MNVIDFDILNRLRQKPRLGQLSSIKADMEALEGTIVTDLLKTTQQISSGLTAQLGDYYKNKVKPAQDELLNSIIGLKQRGAEGQFAEKQAGMLDAMSRIEGINDSMERSIISMTTLEQRNKDLNEAFGISSLDAQIFADSLIDVYDKTGINQDALKQYAIDLSDFTNGFIASTNSVNKASDSQNAYTTSLLAGQKYLQQNLGISKELAVKFEEYAVTMKTSAIDLAKGFQDKDGFISELADKTGLSELQLTKNIIEDIAGLASDIRLEFGKSSSNLELAVMKARMLGTTMDKLSKVGSAVLDVEKSVGGEINYQLLTGQRLLVDGDKSFTQEMRLAKLRKDGPRQAELMYQILEQQQDTLQNNPIAMQEFAGLTGQSSEDVATMINNIERAKQLGITEFLKGPQKDLETKLAELKTKAEADLKNAKTGTDKSKAEQRLTEIKDFVIAPGKTTETAHEQLVQKNLGDITEYVKSFVTTYVRNNGKRVVSDEKGRKYDVKENAVDVQYLGDRIITALRGTDKKPSGLQTMKFDLKGMEAKFGAVYLYKDITSFDAKTGLFKTVKSDVDAVVGQLTNFSTAMSQLTTTIQAQRAKLITGSPAGEQEREKQVTKARTVRTTTKKARGGILDGPSHAQGGIQTAFGELEGGEAIINKKSTEKYTPLLSSINAAEGGETFSPKFKRGGIADKLIKGNSVYNIKNDYNTTNTYESKIDESIINNQTSNIVSNITSKFDAAMTKILNTNNQDSKVVNTNNQTNSIIENITSKFDSELTKILTTNTDVIQSQQKQFELSADVKTYQPTSANNLDMTKLTTVFEKLTTAISSMSSSPLDTKTLARDFADVMKTVNIQTTAVVKSNNSFGESSMNNASRYTS